MKNVGFHENKQCSSWALVPSPPPPTIIVGITAHGQREDVSTTLSQNKTGKHVTLKAKLLRIEILVIFAIFSHFRENENRKNIHFMKIKTAKSYNFLCFYQYVF